MRPDARPASDTVANPIANWSGVLRCPVCATSLRSHAGGFECEAGTHRFGIENGIPLLFWPTGNERVDDVSQTVKAFYEETPFPNYDDLDSVGTLLAKANRSVFGRLLGEQVPLRARVLECGCGTGQLSNFLAVGNRTVFGTDICLNSLGLGSQFAARNHLHNVHFVQQNLFRPVFPEGYFDLVISNGVLHNTIDPHRGFQSIARLVRPGGHLLVGLYHRYGRLITNLRRTLFKLTGDRLTFLDPNLRSTTMSEAKKRAWFMDQYRHPCESQHVIGETMRWIREIGYEFVRSIPSTRLSHRFSPSERLFQPDPPGSTLERAIIELGMISKGSKEGGFFIVIARRPEASGAGSAARSA